MYDLANRAGAWENGAGSEGGSGVEKQSEVTMARRRVTRVGGFTLMELLILLAFLALAVAVALPCFRQSRVVANEVSVVALMRGLAASESQWRQNDPDRNKVADYWTGDVSAMYRTEAAPAGSGTPVAVIDRSAAAADTAKIAGGAAVAGLVVPATGAPAANLLALPDEAPQSGYFLRAMTTTSSGGAYAQDPDGNGQAWTHPNQFGIQAYPERLDSTGTDVFIVDQTGVVYAQNFGDNRPEHGERWPKGDPAGEHWRPLQ